MIVNVSLDRRHFYSFESGVYCFEIFRFRTGFDDKFKPILQRSFIHVAKGTNFYCKIEFLMLCIYKMHSEFRSILEVAMM